MKKLCMKCGRILSSSEFYKNKRYKDGVGSWCKECMCKYNKEMCMLLKLEAMNAFGNRCVHVDEKGIQCSKNAVDDLKELQLAHLNNDGHEHRALISNGQGGCNYYRALQKLGWKTGKFDIVVMCESHHHSVDNSGKKCYNYGKYGKSNIKYKKGKFNDPAWLKNKYKTMILKEIADECRVCLNTIRRRMIEFGIQRRKPWAKP